MSEILAPLKKKGVATALSVLCLAGCTSEVESQADSSASATTKTSTIIPESNVPTVQPNPQMEAILGSAIMSEATHIGDGLYRETTHEVKNGFELDGADIEFASFACHTGRTLEISPIQTDENGDFYTAACNRPGVKKNRPITTILTPTEGTDYSNLVPNAEYKGMTALAHPGDVTLKWIPAGDHTEIRVAGESNYEVAQITVFEAMKPKN